MHASDSNPQAIEAEWTQGTTASVASTAGAPTGRLAWRCRRGMKELDELLQRYLKERYQHASVQEQHAFEQLLEMQDPVLHDHLSGALSASSSELHSVIQHILKR